MSNNKVVEVATKNNKKMFAKLHRFSNGTPTKEDIQEKTAFEETQQNSIKQGYFCPYNADEGVQPSWCGKHSCVYKSICKAYIVCNNT